MVFLEGIMIQKLFQSSIPLQPALNYSWNYRRLPWAPACARARSLSPPPLHPPPAHHIPPPCPDLEGSPPNTGHGCPCSASSSEEAGLNSLGGDRVYINCYCQWIDSDENLWGINSLANISSWPSFPVTTGNSQLMGPKSFLFVTQFCLHSSFFKYDPSKLPKSESAFAGRPD